MARILYLVHRLPYPPNKGDKVRSYHLLRHLAERHEVLLGTFVDDPADEAHVDTLRQWCADVHAVRLHPGRARVTSLSGLLHGEPLTLAYYRDPALMAWVRRQRVDAAVVFSSSMAQYVDDFAGPVLVDFVDVDSAKWTDYAHAHQWPLSWLYRREGRELLRYERAVAARSIQSFFVTDKELALFAGKAPECAGRLCAIGNGVDTRYFSPDTGRDNPYRPDELAVVFTGAMDYWPNVDAVRWFAQDVLPQLRARWPQLSFSIVGRSPTSQVMGLAGDGVRVTGTVADVRPWLQHAAVVVAPLRLARGVQNKVLEAMAMARPVVAAASCVEALGLVRPGQLLAAVQGQEYVDAVSRLIEQPSLAVSIGQAARTCVEEHYSWAAQLSRIDGYLEAA
jgi:sugar transferase (PEP-CTERM/EpsH1 system associated)